MAKVYGKKEVAQTRMIALMKRGFEDLEVIPVKGGGWQVKGDPGLKPVEPSKFGRFLESPVVIEAAHSVDETEINAFDTGATHAAPAHFLRTGQWMKTMAFTPSEDGYDIKLPQAGARLMTASELRIAEAEGV